MRSHRLNRTCVSCGLLISLLHPTQALAQGRSSKPIEVVQIHGDNAAPPPATFDQLWQLASMVVEATIIGFRPADRLVEIPGEAPTVTIETAYVLGDVVYLKPLSSGPSPQPLELLLRGGDRDRGNKIVSVVDSESAAPRIGERYVLFLSLQRGVYRFASRSADSALRVQGQGLIPLGHSPLSRELANQTRAALAERVRAKGRAQ